MDTDWIITTFVLFDTIDRGVTIVTDEKSLIADVMDALAEGNDQPLLDALHQDIQWTWMGSGDLSRTFAGKASVLNELWRSVKTDITPPFRVRATRILAEGDCVVVEGLGTNTTPNGREYNNRYCWIMNMLDGKIVAVKEYMDTDLVRRTFTGES